MIVNLVAVAMGYVGGGDGGNGYSGGGIVVRRPYGVRRVSGTAKGLSKVGLICGSNTEACVCRERAAASSVRRSRRYWGFRTTSPSKLSSASLSSLSRALSACMYNTTATHHVRIVARRRCGPALCVLAILHGLMAPDAAAHGELIGHARPPLPHFSHTDAELWLC